MAQMEERDFGARTRLCRFSHCGNLAMPGCDADYCSTCYALMAQAPGALAAHHHPHCGNRHTAVAAPAPHGAAPAHGSSAMPTATGGSGCHTSPTSIPARSLPKGDVKAQLAAGASGGKLQLFTLLVLARKHGSSASFWAAALEAAGGSLAATHHCLQSTCASHAWQRCTHWLHRKRIEYSLGYLRPPHSAI